MAYRSWPSKNYESKNFILCHGQLQGYGHWSIYDKARGIHTYSNVGYETEYDRLRLTRAYREDRAEFDRLCLKEVDFCIAADAYHPADTIRLAI